MRSWVVGLGLCLGSLSLCLSRVLVLGLVLVLELELLPVALLSVLCYSPLPGPVLPLGLTVLTCLLLLCLFYALQCLPAVCQFTCRFARPLLPPFPCPSSFFSLCFSFISHSLPVLEVSISGCLPVPSVSLPLSLPVVLLFTSVTPKAISNLAKLSNQFKYY